MKKTLVSILFILMIISLDAVELSPSLRVFNYRSYSQQLANMPMIAGYPVITTQSFLPGITLNIGAHEIYAAWSIPAKLSSDDGTGQNFLLNEQGNSYTRVHLDYAWHFPLISKGQFSLFHALNMGLLYENRYMFYESLGYEWALDLNYYIGPRIKMAYALMKDLDLEFTFDGRFYLPYLNTGILRSRSGLHAITYESSYHGFYYNSLFELTVNKAFVNGNSIALKVKSEWLIGYANSRPLFRIDDLIHFKFDRLIHIGLEYGFVFGGQNEK